MLEGRAFSAGVVLVLVFVVEVSRGVDAKADEGRVEGGSGTWMCES